MGGNIWAEMLCRFGYSGLALFTTIYFAGLVGAQRLFLLAPTSLSAPIAFCGALCAFYINRNDLHSTLVMMRQTIGVFVIAITLAQAARMAHGILIGGDITPQRGT
jgi:hypothetical protein